MKTYLESKQSEKEGSISSYTSHQAEISKALRRLALIHPIEWARITDSAEAGNLIGKKPADFYALCEGRFTYLEAKFSEKYETFSSGFSSLVSKSHQLASARTSARAGGSHYFLFYSAKSRLHEVWSGLYCADRRTSGRPLERGRYVLSTTYLEEALLCALTWG